MPEPDTTPAVVVHACDNCDGIDPDTCLMNPDRTEPDNPAATSLARYIADHPMSTVLAATRLLGWRLTIRPTVPFSGRTETGATTAETQAGGGEAGDSGADTHPPVHRWRVEHVDGNEWVPGSGLKADRDEAVHLLNVGNKVRPQWADGTPVRRRLVRETTSYTVETVLTPPAPGGHDGEGQ